MENDETTYTDQDSDNPFLSRGCCHAPQIYQDNSHIASHRCCKLDVVDWLSDVTLPDHHTQFDCVEVRFKNSRKDFFRVTPDMDIKVCDIVAVEASPGHDIGIITMTGEIVKLQMRKKNVDPAADTIKKVYRRARLTDIEKWLNAVDQEDRVQIKARKIARNLRLDMKINDVEFQGDETKAVFFYTAEERVDFRELIKVLADEFKIRIEMRQIGVRQESARLGGIGSCGRELCCATWLTDFTSVTTGTARIQQLSPNPQKLAGQCGKLKCCLNYENDVYLDALKDFPDTNIYLKTAKGQATHQKSDIFKRIMWYAYQNDQNNMLALSVDRVKEIIAENRKGNFPSQLEDSALTREVKVDIGNGGLTEEDISRFDKMEEPASQRRRKKKSRRNAPPGSESRPPQSRDNARPNQQAQTKTDSRPDNKPAAGQESSERPRRPYEQRKRSSERNEPNRRVSNKDSTRGQSNRNKGQRPNRRRKDSGSGGAGSGDKPNPSNE
ncbi:MAG TPA: regulatory iron-sulfur-containing complex subunit RicT [Bacteroidales bacterium]|nr:regulatory iron-sulfur-containing complex subunit RicT [Bacteroidales bacterium]